MKTTTKTCTKCGDTKPLTEFRTITKNEKLRHAAECVVCKRARALRDYHADPEGRAKRSARHAANPAARMLVDSISRAKARGIPNTLSVEDIVIPKVCPVLDIPLQVSTGHAGGMSNSPSLDRIDPTCPSGYSPGNVRVISMRANILKGKLRSPEFSQRLHQRLFDARGDASKMAKLIDHCCVEVYIRNEAERIAAEKAKVVALGQA